MARSARTGIERRLAAGLVLLPLAGACRPSVPESGGPPSSEVRPPTAIGAEASAGPSVRTYDETTAAIAAKVGDRFQVALPGSTSRPFEWRLRPVRHDGVLAELPSTYEDLPRDCPGCGGSEGRFVFPLTAVERGATTLRFAYVHVGEPDDAGPTRELVIEVRIE